MNRPVFVLAGKTGGPLIPALAIARIVANVDIVLVGVKGGFEEVVSKEQSLQLVYLPQAKQNIQNTTKTSLVTKILDVARMVKIGILLVWSVIISIYYLIKYKPRAIITAGSFLGVPMIYAVKLICWAITKPKIIIHQQDVVAGKSNLLIAKYADLLSVANGESKEKYKQFKNAVILPNPVDESRFTQNSLQTQFKSLTVKDPELTRFIANTSKLPLVLIFGGGSGSEYINQWTQDWKEELTKRFKVIHLTGKLRQSLHNKNNPNYICRDVVSEEFGYLLSICDLVISRSGMGTIAELLYLQKPAFLIPMPNSHQLENALSVSEYFGIWEQGEVYYTTSKSHPEWVDELVQFDLPAAVKKFGTKDEQKLLTANYKTLLNKTIV
jgi:UDP-N-acetylglucosamine:LPS N-acetylglucosamine transferase